MSRYVCFDLGPALAACDSDSTTISPTAPAVTFFVTSATSITGNLGGLTSADAICSGWPRRPVTGSAPGARTGASRMPATATGRPTPGAGSAPGPGTTPPSCRRQQRDRAARAARRCRHLLDQRGQRINGQWTNSPRPVEHDILTGSTAEGTLMAGMTCNDWTSAGADVAAQVGHSDGFGPNQDTSGKLASWNSAHVNQKCSNTAVPGGAGRLYCFARN